MTYQWAFLSPHSHIDKQFTYLLSQHFKFVCPGLYIRQSVSNLSGLLSHASGSFLDGFQSTVPQLFDLDVQWCQIGVALQLRCWETGEDSRQPGTEFGSLVNWLNKPFSDLRIHLTFYYIKKCTENKKYLAAFFSNTISSVYLSMSSISWLSNFSHTSTSSLSETLARMAVLNAFRLDCWNNRETEGEACTPFKPPWQTSKLAHVHYCTKQFKQSLQDYRG